MQTFEITDDLYGKSLEVDSENPLTGEDIDSILDEARKGYVHPEYKPAPGQVNENAPPTPTSFTDIAGQLQKAPSQPKTELPGQGMFQQLPSERESVGPTADIVKPEEKPQAPIVPSKSTEENKSAPFFVDQAKAAITTGIKDVGKSFADIGAIPFKAASKIQEFALTGLGKEEQALKNEDKINKYIQSQAKQFDISPEEEAVLKNSGLGAKGLKLAVEFIGNAPLYMLPIGGTEALIGKLASRYGEATLKEVFPTLLKTVKPEMLPSLKAIASNFIGAGAVSGAEEAGREITAGEELQPGKIAKAAGGGALMGAASLPIGKGALTRAATSAAGAAVASAATGATPEEIALNALTMGAVAGIHGRPKTKPGENIPKPAGETKMPETQPEGIPNAEPEGQRQGQEGQVEGQAPAADVLKAEEGAGQAGEPAAPVPPEKREANRITLESRKEDFLNNPEAQKILANMPEEQRQEVAMISAKLGDLHPLTKMPSKSAWHSEIDKIRNNPDPNNSYFYFEQDFDWFKAQNDNFGEAWGDEFLKKTMPAIRQVYEENRINFYHKSGDEVSGIASIPKGQEGEFLNKLPEIKKQFEDIDIVLPNGNKINLSTTIGVSSKFDKENVANKVLKKAKNDPNLGKNSLAIDSDLKKDYNIDDIKGPQLLQQYKEAGLTKGFRGEQAKQPTTEIRGQEIGKELRQPDIVDERQETTRAATTEPTEKITPHEPETPSPLPEAPRVSPQKERAAKTRSKLSEPDEESWRRGLAKTLRREILAQPRGKEQWDYVNGKTTRDKKNQIIHFTEKTRQALQGVYDFYETTEGKESALKHLGMTENPFADFEDVASVLQKGGRAFEKPDISKQTEDQSTEGMSDQEINEYEKYFRQRDKEVGLEGKYLDDGIIAFSKRITQTDLLGGKELTPEEQAKELKSRQDREEIKRRLSERPKLGGGAVDPNAPMWQGTGAIEGEQTALFSKGQPVKGRFTTERLNEYYKNSGLGKLIEAVDELPENIQNSIKSKGYQPWEIEAAFDPNTQKIYVRTGSMRNKSDILRTARHEITHLGLRVTLKDRINPIYEAIYKRYKDSDIGKEIIKNYFGKGFDESKQKGRMTFADEVLARLGETNVDPGYFRSIITRIKQLLIKKFPGIKFTDADVRAMIARGQREGVKFGEKMQKTEEKYYQEKFGELNDNELRELYNERFGSRGETLSRETMMKDIDINDREGYGDVFTGRGTKVENTNLKEVGNQQSVAVTPEMRESVMEGQPLFSKADERTNEQMEEMYPEPKKLKNAIMGKRETFFDKAKSLHHQITSIEGKYSPAKKVMMEFDASMQNGYLSTKNAIDFIKKKVPDKKIREAISVYREAEGKIETLKEWASKTDDKKLREKYELAQNLSDDEKQTAKTIGNLYDKLYKRGRAWGIIEGFRKNYVTHMIGGEDKPNGYAGKLLTNSKLKKNFEFGESGSRVRPGEERVFPTLFDAEQQGYYATRSDAGDLMGAYIQAMEKVINTKKFIRTLANTKAKDGRPLAAVEESGNKTEINPDQMDMFESKAPAREERIDYNGYRSIDNSALSKWMWAKEDETGKKALFQGQMMLHPDIYKQAKRILGTSAIREWYMDQAEGISRIPRGFLKYTDKIQAITKQAMFSLSGFHYVQEGTHALFHQTNPFSNIPKIDFEKNPEHWYAAQHGLRLVGEYNAMTAFQEGLGGGPVLYKVPLLGRMMEWVSEPLFTRYIPGLKFKTWKHMMDRNLKLFDKEIKSGKVSKDDVAYLCSQQTNAAFGHLNFSDLGMNVTFKHILQLGLVAPDFLIARGFFAAQGLKTLLGSKAGIEQARALTIGAVTMLALPAIINKLINNDWHLDDYPFRVVVGNKKYFLRSVPEDLYRLFTETPQFIRGRINPVIGRPLDYFFTGHDYRGQKQSLGEFLLEYAGTWIPISMRALVPGQQTNKDINAWDSFLNSAGVQVSRYSPMTRVYNLVDDWKKKNGLPEFEQGQFPPSKYRDLRNAIQDENPGRVKLEWNKLIKESKTPSEVLKGFQTSLHKHIAGSLENDKKFIGNLSEADRKVYYEAMKQRIQTFGQFQKLLAESRQK